MIIVVEGPSAAGKTTWCRTHAANWIPEPERAPLPDVLRAQRERWRTALAADEAGEVIVLDGDPLKLWYAYAERVAGSISEPSWLAAVDEGRYEVQRGDLGFADLVLYGDPGVDELRRRKEADATRTRRSFERHTAMVPSFRRWYEALAEVGATVGEPRRVIWEHPPTGLGGVLRSGRIEPRAVRSDPGVLDAVLARLAVDGQPSPPC